MVISLVRGMAVVCMIVYGFVPAAASEAGPSPTGCMTCHQGIEDIRASSSEMMLAIRSQGRDMGDPDGCTVCHGGDPLAKTKDTAHAGVFYPDPGSPWVNEKTCGLCHKEQVRVQWQSLMMTEAGKIQGVAWSAGGLTGYEARWANYDVKNPDDPHARLGSEAYRAYKQKLAALEPQAFPDRHVAVSQAPEDLKAVKKDSSLAAFTYIRQECERCHLAVRGRQRRGDYRGMGCSACHIPYSNEGLYEGGDPTIPQDQTGHLLVHTIQATREARVTLNKHSYSGIPVETCTTCHDRGKRIGVSFQGLMESAFGSPWGDGATSQPGLHTKHYISMKGDIHYTKYHMVCQDCHTTLDVHGDGFLSGTTLASVEIECTDCHGTPARYPWELPLGYGDEYGSKPGKGPRGMTTKLLGLQKRQGTSYPPEDGYLLSARGNPLGNVVRRGNRVIVHTAGGDDLQIKPLKLLANEKTLSLDARVAMVNVSKHIQKMECYTCHAKWAPQCYGCHVKIDYSKGAMGYDWVAAGNSHTKFGNHADNHDSPKLMIPGHIKETRSYLRWEDPALGVSGEGRISPIIPGCQVNYTVVGADGEAIVKNKIFRTPAGTEGGGVAGQLSIDMSPVQPHTNGRQARSCESCHASPKAAGYGIDAGYGIGSWEKGRIVDLTSPDGTILPRNAQTQIEPIPGLVGDWSRVVTEDGKQLQTVGHHFKGSRPLNNTERGCLSREGLCLGCHQEIPKGSLAVSILRHIAIVSGQLPDSAGEHASLLNKILLMAGWAQVLALVVIPFILVFWLFVRRRV